jgi:hypothetical protein
MPPFAKLLGLYGRSDRPARALGGRLARPRQAYALPPLGHVRLRSGAGKLAGQGALVAPLDLCGSRQIRPRREINLSFFPGLQQRQRHRAGI